MLQVENNFEEAVDVDTDSQFGNSERKQAKSFEKTNYFQLNSGTNVYRIMPPMFSCLEEGHWAVYYGRHFGYFDERGKQKSYSCMKKYDKETRALVEDCPFCLDQESKLSCKKSAEARVTTLANQIDTLQSKGKTASDLQELIGELEDAKRELSVATRQYSARQQRFWVNAMNLDGEFGLLALPKTVYEALQGKRTEDKESGKFNRAPGLLQWIKEKEKIDALDVNQGCFWSITRSGSSQFDTEYTVTPYKTERQLDDDTVVWATKKAPLSAEQKKQALVKCKDLNHAFDYMFLSQEQALAVINGGSSAVTAVENAPRPVEVEQEVSKPVASVAPVAETPKHFPSDKELLEKFKKKK